MVGELVTELEQCKTTISMTFANELMVQIADENEKATKERQQAADAREAAKEESRKAEEARKGLIEERTLIQKDRDCSPFFLLCLSC
jgi:DNA gyrase/topoisomerase IV subunit B